MTLADHINKTFVKDRHGIKTTVILKEVLRNKVLVQCPDRQDTFKLSLTEFEKYYRPVETAA